MAKYSGISDEESIKIPVSARVISKMTNPCALSIVMLTGEFISNPNLNKFSLLKWILTIIFFLIILPLVYVYLHTSSKYDKAYIRADPTLYLKRHPWDIIILAVVCGIPCLLVLNALDAPAFTLITLVTLLGIAFIIAFINLKYRVSFHLAAIVAIIYLFVVFRGLWWVWLVLFIPAIAWAKYRLHDHDFFQMILGIVIGAAVTSITLYFCF